MDPAAPEQHRGVSVGAALHGHALRGPHPHALPPPRGLPLPSSRRRGRWVARDAKVLGLVACRACAPGKRTPTPAPQAVGGMQQRRDSCGRCSGWHVSSSPGATAGRRPSPRSTACAAGVGVRLPGAQARHATSPRSLAPQRPSRRGAESLHGKVFGAMRATVSPESGEGRGDGDHEARDRAAQHQSADALGAARGHPRARDSQGNPRRFCYARALMRKSSPRIRGPWHHA